MAVRNFRQILVVGDNPEEIVAKYDIGTKVEPYVSMKREDKKKMHKKHVTFLESLLTSNAIKLTERQKEIYKDMYLEVKDMDDDEWFESFNDGCTFNENGDAVTTLNPNAFYCYPQNPQKHLEAHGDEHDFATPFKLANGDIAYSALKMDIDWEKMHLGGREIYERAWEICVDGSEPRNPQEEHIKDMMAKRQAYFALFKNKEEYVAHNTSFWYYGFATDKNYSEVDYKVSDKEWVRTFYDKFVKDLPDNARLSIFVVKGLND